MSTYVYKWWIFFFKMVLEINLPEVNHLSLFLWTKWKETERGYVGKKEAKKGDGKTEENHKVRDDWNGGEQVRVERRKERRNLLFPSNEREI